MFDYLFFLPVPSFLISFMFLLHFYFVFAQSSTTTSKHHHRQSLSVSLFFSFVSLARPPPDCLPNSSAHIFGLITHMNSLPSIYVHVFERRSRWHRQMNESNLLALNHGFLVLLDFFSVFLICSHIRSKTTFFPLHDAIF